MARWCFYYFSFAIVMFCYTLNSQKQYRLLFHSFNSQEFCHGLGVSSGLRVSTRLNSHLEFETFFQTRDCCLVHFIGVGVLNPHFLQTVARDCSQQLEAICILCHMTPCLHSQHVESHLNPSHSHFESLSPGKIQSC